MGSADLEGYGDNTFGAAAPTFYQEDGQWKMHMSRRGALIGLDWMANDVYATVQWNTEGRPYIMAKPDVGRSRVKIWLDDTWKNLDYDSKAEYFTWMLGYTYFDY